MKYKIIIFIRNLQRQKLSSFITIGGLSITLAVIIILTSFVYSELQYDKFHSNIDNIYRLITKERESSFPEFLKEKFSDIPSITSIARYNNGSTSFSYNNTDYEAGTLQTEPDFFRIFSVQFLLGNSTIALKDKNSVVITQSFAKKVFNNENPVGKSIDINHGKKGIVTSVIQDFPITSSIKFDVISRIDLKVTVEGNCFNDSCIDYYRNFVLLNNHAIKTDVERQIFNRIQQFKDKDNRLKDLKQGVLLLPFKKSYFDTTTEGSLLKHANVNLIKVIIIITLLVLLLAILNYINITTAFYSSRFKEVGIKKAIGSRRNDIYNQFLTESFLSVFIAFIVGYIISIIIKPLFEGILDKKIDINILFSIQTLAGSIAILLVLSIICGFYPAYFIARLKPITILGKTGSKRNIKSLRYALIVVQFFISITLIISLLFILKQVKYIKTKDFGFKTEQLVQLDIHWKAIDKIPLLKHELDKCPGIIGITSSHGTPGAVYSSSSWNEAEDKFKFSKNIPQFGVDANFFNVFQIPIVSGRNFDYLDEEKAVIINETAYKLIKWKNLEGKKIFGLDVIGVAKDFHIKDFHTLITPAFFICSKGNGRSHIVIRIRPDNIPQTMTAISATWKSICPDFLLKYRFYNEWLESMYKEEEKLSKSILIFAVIAILISCLGIFGLSEYLARNQTKAIGIRKVNGASIIKVMAMLNKDFVRWIFIAFIIASPTAWFAMHKWLQNFAYKTDLSWWVFGVAGIVAAAVALLTVSWQSWRAATRNPVEALKYE